MSCEIDWCNRSGEVRKIALGFGEHHKDHTPSLCHQHWIDLICGDDDMFRWLGTLVARAKYPTPTP